MSNIRGLVAPISLLWVTFNLVFFPKIAFGQDSLFSAPVYYNLGYGLSAVSASDLDVDGDIDLAVADNDDYSVKILLNDGLGGFAEIGSYGVGANPIGVFAADLDGDNDNDLCVANDISQNASVLINNGAGTFQPAVNYGVSGRTYDVNLGDVDGDNDEDMIVAVFSINSIAVLKNNGDGTFSSPSFYQGGTAPQSIFSADFDGDNDLDIAAANSGSGNISIFFNAGDGTFLNHTEYPLGSIPQSIFGSDLNADNLIDLAVALRGADSVAVLANNGIGFFSMVDHYVVGSDPYSIKIADFNWDGIKDIVVSNLFSDNFNILLGNGDGTFIQNRSYVTAARPYKITFADFDNDSDEDLAVPCFEAGQLVVLFNQMPYSGPVWHVSIDGDDVTGDGSEQNPFATIQHGIDMANNGDTVLVSNGTYTGVGNRNINFHGKSIVLKGIAGRDLTIIDTEGISQAIEFSQNEDTLTVVDGFSIRNGTIALYSTPLLMNLIIGNNSGIFISTYDENQIYIIRDCHIDGNQIGISYYSAFANNTLNIDNCQFRNNTLGFSAYGSGSFNCQNNEFIANQTGYSSGPMSGNYQNKIFEDCIFDGNEIGLYGTFTINNSIIKNGAYGVQCHFYYYCRITECTFENISNTAIFSASIGINRPHGFQENNTILTNWANVKVFDSIIRNNPGIIAYLNGYSEDPVGILFNNCIIQYNGGGIDLGPQGSTDALTMANCLYSNNSGPIYFAGINAYSTAISILNCTITQNYDSGLLIYIGTSGNPISVPIEIENNIIADNNGIGVSFEFEGGCTDSSNLILYSDVHGNLEGDYFGIPDQTGLNGNISENPLFVDPGNADFHLQCSSPCVDTGLPDSLDADGTRSDMGAYFLPHYYAPTATTAIAPPNGSEVDSLYWLTWLESSDADTSCKAVSYNLQIDEDPSFEVPEVDEILLPGRRLILDETISYQIRSIPGWENLLDDSTYFWRLKSVDEVGDTSAWTDGSDHFFYNSTNSAPSPPIDGFSPSNGEEVISLTPMITWNHGGDPDPSDNAENFRYAIRLSQNEDFSGFVYSDTTNAGTNQIQPTEELEDNSHYFYGVITIDDEGLSSGWSETQDFWTNHYNFPPEPFPIYGPEDSTVQVVYYTHFTWGNTVDYDPMSSFTFTFEYSTNGQFENPVISREGLTETSYTIETDSLALLGQDLFWRVKAVDDDGLIRIGGIPEEGVRFLKILPPGDANSSGSVNIADVIYLFNFLRGMGDPPDPLLAGDANGNCMVNIADVIYLFDFLVGEGNPPVRGDCQGILIFIEDIKSEEEKIVE